MNLYGMDWVGSLASLGRQWLFSNATGRSRLWGWILGFVGGIGWLVVSILVGSWPMVGVNVLYLVISVRGLVKEARR